MTVLVLVLIIKIQLSFNPSLVYSTKGPNKVEKVIKLLNKMSLSSFRKQIRTTLIDGFPSLREIEEARLCLADGLDDFLILK